MTVVEFVKKDENTFGGDNYWFVDGDDQYLVAVAWALLDPYMTIVFKNGERIAEFNDERYILPEEAFSRLEIKIKEIQ